MKNAMGLKARIRTIAQQKGISAQSVLQSYMFERFLVRLSESSYKDNFILKGGLLVAAVVGIQQRSTMDMDISIKNYPLDEHNLGNAVSEICSIVIDDGVIFQLKKIELIHEKDLYGGFRVGLITHYDTIFTHLAIDFTTGDAITPKEILFSYKNIMENGSIGIWVYPIETILAEKVETILQRGEANTRPRDFHDIFLLVAQPYDNLVFAEALRRTMEHRRTSYLLDETARRVATIESSIHLNSRWKTYAQTHPYAKEIQFGETIQSLHVLLRHVL